MCIILIDSYHVRKCCDLIGKFQPGSHAQHICVSYYHCTLKEKSSSVLILCPPLWYRYWVGTCTVSSHRLTQQAGYDTQICNKLYLALYGVTEYTLVSLSISSEKKKVNCREFEFSLFLAVDNNPCENNGGCDTMCLLAPNGGKTCTCPENFVLGEDGVSCKSNCLSSMFVCSSTYKCIPFWWKCDTQVRFVFCLLFMILFFLSFFL